MRYYVAMSIVTCIACGYDLCAHTETYKPGVVCPECGEKDAAREPPERMRDSVPLRLVAAFVLFLVANVAVKLREGNDVSAIPACLLAVSLVGAFACSLSALRRSKGTSRILPWLFVAITGSMIALLMVEGVARRLGS